VNQREPLPPSLYADTARPAIATPPLDESRQVSVVIIGGGFTGLSTALHLAENGVDVTVLEAHEPGWGASGRNGGQVNPGLKHDPDVIEADFGADFFATIRREMQALVADPGYAALLGAFGPGLLDRTGSRPAAFRVGLTFQGKQGLIVLDQIRTLDRTRLVKRLGALRPQTLAVTLQTLQSMFAP
jgi:glycine/D-amino acid oxidase-like deaminating enzyme